jgi:uncharacterized protein (TIGR03437 family)
VTFAVLAGGGTLSVAQGTTDAQGQVSTSFTAGSAAGPVTIAATAGALSGSPVTFTTTVVSVTTPLLPANPVVNGASFRPAGQPGSAIAPGSIVSIFGTNLASGAQAATTVPLPNSLLDATVTFNGLPAPLFGVSDGQINAQVPFEAPLGLVSVQVKRGDNTSSAQTVIIAPVSPGIFTVNQQGTGQGAILISNSAIFAAPAGTVTGQQTRPARRGEFISIFCSGLGYVTNLPASGQAASGTLSVTLATPTVSIGGITVPVAYSGLSAYVGLYQVDVQVPSTAPAGDAVDVVLNIGGVSSNRVTIAVQE